MEAVGELNVKTQKNMMDTAQENKELILIFNELLRYGFSKLQGFPLHLDKYRLKKKLLHRMMAATQSYSEAILKLMGTTPVYDKAAEVLYRSLVENLINLGFIYSSKTQENALIFSADSIQDSNDFAKRYKALMLKYPTWKLDFGHIDTPEKWDKFIADNNKKLARYQKRNKVTLPNKLFGLKKRAIVQDDFLKAKNKFNQGKSFESYYVTYYKFFSQVAHLTLPGLERFFVVRPDGSMHLIIDGDQESVGRILAITYQIYFVFLRFTLQELKLFNIEEYKKFDNFSKNMIRGPKQSREKVTSTSSSSKL